MQICWDIILLPFETFHCSFLLWNKFLGKAITVGEEVARQIPLLLKVCFDEFFFKCIPIATWTEQGYKIQIQWLCTIEIWETGREHLKNVIHTKMFLHSFCFVNSDLKLCLVWISYDGKMDSNLMWIISAVGLWNTRSTFLNVRFCLPFSNCFFFFFIFFPWHT